MALNSDKPVVPELSCVALKDKTQGENKDRTLTEGSFNERQ